MTTPLSLNNRPVGLPATQSADTTNPTSTADSSFFVIQPTNLEATYRVQSGATTLPSSIAPPIPAGQPIPYPISTQWSNNRVTITNTSGDNSANFDVGYFGMPAVLPYCNGSSANIQQYGVVSFRTPAQTRTLQIKARDPALVAILQGANPPAFVALNIDKGALSTPYKNLIDSNQLSAESDNTYSVSANFFGATLTVVNVSIGANTDVEVSLF
ncbi:hypothetical protein BTA51_09290 [Hahella sp. CCB-MM4]|uniref:hypothetical protein n=1 Tax=Hahella sp. (strain CCB-MM4) TaxID=1926491 RepID=UPI000B9AB1AA|nr:hypothetical protein [Hahella sp. CCB-MM4]OZG73963.1 hypothetical protein BTA51_09290 [Hahella sp. CCB-MM4]